MSEPIIRAMQQADLPAVSKLAAQLVRLHATWDRDRFMVIEPVEDGYAWFLSTQLQSPEVVLLVAEVDGQIAGYLYAAVRQRDWEMLLDRHGALHDVFVDERFRRLGIARRLCDEGIRRLEAHHVPRIVLSTAVPNTGAQALFEALGFRRTMIEMTRTRAR